MWLGLVVWLGGLGSIWWQDEGGAAGWLPSLQPRHRKAARRAPNSAAAQGVVRQTRPAPSACCACRSRRGRWRRRAGRQRAQNLPQLLQLFHWPMAAALPMVLLPGHVGAWLRRKPAPRSCRCCPGGTVVACFWGVLAGLGGVRAAVGMPGGTSLAAAAAGSGGALPRADTSKGLQGWRGGICGVTRL